MQLCRAESDARRRFLEPGQSISMYISCFADPIKSYCFIGAVHDLVKPSVWVNEAEKKYLLELDMTIDTFLS